MWASTPARRASHSRTPRGTGSRSRSDPSGDLGTPVRLLRARAVADPQLLLVRTVGVGRMQVDVAPARVALEDDSRAIRGPVGFPTVGRVLRDLHGGEAVPAAATMPAVARHPPMTRQDPPAATRPSTDTRAPPGTAAGRA